jgi:hypothetical protein
MKEEHIGRRAISRCVSGEPVTDFGTIRNAACTTSGQRALPEAALAPGRTGVSFGISTIVLVIGISTWVFGVLRQDSNCWPRAFGILYLTAKALNGHGECHSR